MTANRFIILNAPSRANFIHDFCSPLSVDEFHTTPWLAVPGRKTINLKEFANLTAKSLDFFRLSHLAALPLRSHLFFPYLRVCPLCLEAGYHTVLTSLRAMQRCPIHDIELERECDCGKPILEGFNSLLFGKPGTCSCGESLISHQAAINPTIDDTKIEAFSSLADWLLNCGTSVFFSEGSDALHADAACFWADEHHLYKPLVFGKARDHEQTVLVHQSTRWIGFEHRPFSFEEFPIEPDSKRWRFKRMTIENHLANPLGSIFSSICRYIRRHILPNVDALSMTPSFVTHRWSYYGGERSVPPLLAAYVQYQYFGGKNYFERTPRLYSKYFPYRNKDPEPKPVPFLKSPFDARGLLLDGPFFSQYSGGATWLRERAAADIMWATWKLCADLTLEATSTGKNRVDFRIADDPVPVKHWSAAFIDGRYVLRSVVVKAVGVSPRPRRTLTKSQRASEIELSAEEGLKRKLQEIDQEPYQLRDDGSWALSRPLHPAARAVARPWLQRKKLYVDSSEAVHFYLYPSSSCIVARSIAPPIEVQASNSYGATMKLKEQVNLFLAGPRLG